jgi:hypothetical protein
MVGEMTSVLTATLCVVAAAAILSLRKDMIALAHTIAQGIRNFKATLKQIDDDL